MRLILDTQSLPCAAGSNFGSADRLPTEAATLIGDTPNESFFSAASIREIVIKHSLGRNDLTVDPRLLRRGLFENG